MKRHQSFKLTPQVEQSPGTGLGVGLFVFFLAICGCAGFGLYGQRHFHYSVRFSNSSEHDVSVQLIKSTGKGYEILVLKGTTEGIGGFSRMQDHGVIEVKRGGSLVATIPVSSTEEFGGEAFVSYPVSGNSP